MLARIRGRRLLSAKPGIVQMASNIKWIGAIDWDVREFHSLHIPKGTTYNSYLITSSKPTIVEAVRDTLADEWIGHLRTICGDSLSQVKQIVLNHAEPDHTSGMKKLMAMYPHIELVCTKKNFETLSRLYDISKWKRRIIKGDELFSVGEESMLLHEVPLAHWPESCIGYMPKSKIVFSNDAFGQHLAGNQRWVDEVDQDLYLHEARSYYGNILLRLGKPVLKAISAAKSLPGISKVLTAHGLCYRRQEDIERILKLYETWAKQKPVPKVIILYDGNWYGTEKMAHAIASGASTVDSVDVKIFHARKTHITDVATEIIDCPCIAVGSAVLHEDVLPDLATHMSYLRCLGIKDKAGLIFGTYGWTKNAAVKQIRSQLFEPRKVRELAEPLLVPWGPSREELTKCEEEGARMAQEAISIASIK